MNSEEEACIKRLAMAFQDAGKELYLVGGIVRDELLQRASHDIDCTTNALPDEIKAIAANTNALHIVPVGEKFGTIQLIYPSDIVIEVTTYRNEQYQSGSRHPDVRFSQSLQEDLRRRDFTINAIAKDPLTGSYVDPFDGKRHLKEGVIQAVENPTKRFLEDPLRLLRAIRFAERFSFTIEKITAFAIALQAHHIQTISQERIRDELSKILLGKDVYYGFQMLSDSGLLAYVLPEVQALRGVTQPPHHALDVFDHTIIVVGMCPVRLVLRWAALLHDIAKPQTRTVDANGNAHFYEHEDIGAKLAGDILQRLRFSNDFIEQVTKIIQLHMRVNSYKNGWSNASVRRLFVDAGTVLDDLLELAIADGISDRNESRTVVQARIFELREKMCAVQLQALRHPLVSPLDGNELMALFRRGPGPWLKPMKDYLSRLVIDGELAPNDKNAARMEAIKHQHSVGFVVEGEPYD